MSAPFPRKWPVKDPDEELKYVNKWKEAAEDPIVDSNWEIEDTDGELTDMENSGITSPDKTYIWLSGGTAGESYTVKNTVTFTSNLKFVRRTVIKVELR